MPVDTPVETYKDPVTFEDIPAERGEVQTEESATTPKKTRKKPVWVAARITEEGLFAPIVELQFDSSVGVEKYIASIIKEDEELIAIRIGKAFKVQEVTKRQVLTV